MYQSKSLASRLALQLRGSSYRLHVNLAQKMSARAFGTSKSPYQDRYPGMQNPEKVVLTDSEHNERPLESPASIGTEEWFKSDAEDMIKQYEKFDGPEHFAARSDIESSVKDRFGGTLTEHAKEVLKEKLLAVGSRVKETVKEKVSGVTTAAKDSAASLVFGKKPEASVEEMERDLAAQTKSAAETLADKAKAAVYQVKEAVAESETANALKEKAEKTASNMKDKVKDMAAAGMSSANETVSEKMHQAKDAAKEKLQDAMPSMGDMKAKASEVVKQAKEKGSEMAGEMPSMGDMKAKASEVMQQAKEKGSEMVGEMPSMGDMKAKASEVMQQAKEKGSEMAGEMPSMGDMKAKASEVVQQAKEKGSEMAGEMPSMGAMKAKASEVMQQAKEKGSEMAGEMPSMGDMKAKASEAVKQAKEKGSEMAGTENVKGGAGTFRDAVKKAIEFEFVEPLSVKTQPEPDRIVKQPSTMDEWMGDLNLGEVRKSADHAVEKVKAAAHIAKDKLGDLAHRAEEAVERTMQSSNVTGAAEASSNVKAKGEAAMGKMKQKGREVKEKVKAGVSEAVPEEIPDDFNPDRIAVAVKSAKKQAAEAAKPDDAFYKQEHILKGDTAELHVAPSPLLPTPPPSSQRQQQTGFDPKQPQYGTRATSSGHHPQHHKGEGMASAYRKHLGAMADTGEPGVHSEEQHTTGEAQPQPEPAPRKRYKTQFHGASAGQRGPTETDSNFATSVVDDIDVDEAREMLHQMMPGMASTADSLRYAKKGIPPLAPEVPFLKEHGMISSDQNGTNSHVIGTEIGSENDIKQKAKWSPYHKHKRTLFTCAKGNWAEQYRNPIFRRKFADVPGVGSFGNNVVKQSSQDKMTPSMDALGDMSSAAETAGMKDNEETFDHIRYEDLEFDDRVESLGMEPPEQNWETDMIQHSVADAEKEANSMVHDLSQKTQAARKHLRK